MSKRHGNFLTARDLREQGVDAAAVRLLFLQTHYRQSVDFNDDALAGAAEGVKRLGEFRERLAREARNQKRDEPLNKISPLVETDVAGALNDDLNAPRAIAALFDFVRVANRELDQGGGGATFALAALDRLMEVFDVLPTPRALDPVLASWVEERIAARAQARKSKDFKAADAIRAELAGRGVEIEDTPLGTKWKTR
jgi:cysteinyl-tRNA synthetase